MSTVLTVSAPNGAKSMTAKSAEDIVDIDLCSNDATIGNRATKFTRNLYVRCPAVLPTAVETAAQSQFMTSSEYVRRSVVERLCADGIDVGQFVGVV